PDVRQKIHLQSRGAVAFARLAAASRFVEAEAAGGITANLGFGHLRKQPANFIKQLDVRRRVGARRTADRRLIDIDDLVNVLGAGNAVVGADRVRLAVFLAVGLIIALACQKTVTSEQTFLQDVIDQRAFTGAADAGDGNQQAERNLDVNVFQVVLPSAEDLD